MLLKASPTLVASSSEPVSGAICCTSGIISCKLVGKPRSFSESFLADFAASEAEYPRLAIIRGKLLSVSTLETAEPIEPVKVVPIAAAAPIATFPAARSVLFTPRSTALPTRITGAVALLNLVLIALAALVTAPLTRPKASATALGMCKLGSCMDCLSALASAAAFLASAATFSCALAYLVAAALASS